MRTVPGVELVSAACCVPLEGGFGLGVQDRRPPARGEQPGSWRGESSRIAARNGGPGFLLAGQCNPLRAVTRRRRWSCRWIFGSVAHVETNRALREEVQRLLRVARCNVEMYSTKAKIRRRTIASFHSFDTKSRDFLLVISCI